MSVRLRIGEAAVRAAVEAVKAGKAKLSVAAKGIGCSESTLRNRMLELGLSIVSARGNRLSAEGRKELVRALLAGEHVPSLARRLGVNATTVWQARRRLTGETRVVYAWDRASLRRACEQGMTATAIAAALGRPVATVRRALRSRGLRPAKDSRRKRVDVAAMIRDYRAGVSMSEMARRHGFYGPTSVRARLERELPHLRAKKNNGG